MAIRINPDVATMPVRRYLDKAQRQSDKAMAAIASGSRIVNASDDAAGFAIAASLEGQLKGIGQARFNARNAQALMNTAQGGLNEQANIILRLRELAVQAASDTVGDSERELLDNELQQLVKEFDRIAKTTRFGNKELLSGTGEEFSFHVGPHRDEANIISFKADINTRSDEVGIEGLDISDKDEAKSSLEELDEAQSRVAVARANLGAIEGRFDHVIDHLSAQGENIAQAKSLITDADVAEEVSHLVHAQIATDFGVSILAQANQSSQKALRLIV